MYFVEGISVVIPKQKWWSGTPLFSASRLLPHFYTPDILEMLVGSHVGVIACISAVLLFYWIFCRYPFLLKHDGNLWPKDGIQNKQLNRALPDMRHGNVSLIPLRGSENEMRMSVAAFSQDSVSVSIQLSHWALLLVGHPEQVILWNPQKTFHVT